MQSFNRIIFDLLDAGTPLVLVTVITQEGSAPRTAGARMLVLPDGSIRGTVGGGRYEADGTAAALGLYAARGAGKFAAAQGQPGLLLSFSLQGVTDMDMVCGGALTLLLEYLPASPSFQAMFRRACAAESKGEPVAFVTEFSGSGNALAVERVLRLAGETKGLSDELRKTAGEFLAAAGDAAPANAVTRCFKANGHDFLLEYFPVPWRLYIFGGGHVSLEVADLAGSVDFQCTVLDDRPEFAAPERFPTAAAKLLPSLRQEDAAAFLAAENLGRQDGVVIVTRGHAHDRDVLAALLPGKEAQRHQPGRPGYIGMIGSKSKRGAVYAALRQTGVSDEELASVHSPIGLSIGAETPREIAVSVVAELIAWRSGKNRA